ncbi:hypothetical protein JWH04_02450, partial [Xanthomonas melonis]|nr:hypothetical protein [Xanthomonas melonis]
MSRNGPIFQDHHNIEQQTLKNSRLLAALDKAGLFEVHAPINRIFLPADPRLANSLGITPHSGGPIRDYQSGILIHLDRLERTADGKAALRGEPEALNRVAARVENLRDTMRAGLINGDLYTNAPLGMVADDIRPRVQAFLADQQGYGASHTQQIGRFKVLPQAELGWTVIAHSEPRVLSTLYYMGQSTANLTKGGDPEIGRNSLSQAIAQAHAAGRLTLSDQGILQVEHVLGEEAARPLRIPAGQRGFATAELLAGDLSAGQALRTAGLFATAADTVMTGQRATRLLGQDNPLAAQSELAHFAGRNVVGWAGGTAAAYALGSSGAGPMVLIAADAYFMTKAGEKAAELLDNRAIYTQTDREGTQ